MPAVPISKLGLMMVVTGVCAIAPAGQVAIAATAPISICLYIRCCLLGGICSLATVP